MSLEARSRLTQTELDALAVAHERSDATSILTRAAALFPGRLTFATGFGVEGCVVIDLVAKAGLDVDFFTLDTGVLFPETYALWAQLEARYGLKIRAIRAPRSILQQAADEGPELWARDPDRCCELRKVQPLTQELSHFDAWITAIRRDQTPDRANAKPFERDRKFGLAKVGPLVRWSSKDVWNHVVKHDVPYNPLHDRGFPSIGCEPCTSSVKDGEDPRAGRWRGSEKKECGLHVLGTPAKTGS